MEYTDIDDRFWLNAHDRRNILYFDYFAVKHIYGFLSNFAWMANIIDRAHFFPAKIQTPPEYFCRNDIYDIDTSLKAFIEYFECEACFSNEDVSMLRSYLHMLMNVLPYLNERHYNLCKYEYENYMGEIWCSYDELLNFDKSLAKRIAPVLREFSQYKLVPPSNFPVVSSIHGAKSPICQKYETYIEWRKTMSVMVDAWEWLALRDNVAAGSKWEDVPDKVYNGLHLFAEYLSEMQICD
ncbi:MAG: hypothetical protein K2K76_01995 [Muribaculaceae bacterium]|nr:hypothetical protein [Muribaculaceae bacterium]